MRLSQSSSYLPINSNPINSQLTPVSDIPPAQPIRQGLAALGRYLQDFIVGSHEPVIEEKCDRNGNLYWRVYDPITQDLKFFDSEDEVRVWLDQRYYQ